MGADYKFETARGERSREFLMGPNAGNTMYDNVWQDGQIAKIGLFAELTKSYNDFRFVASARLESNNAKLDDPQASI